MKSVFDIPFENLPPTIPIFPLPGAVLLPDGMLTLNIFEKRYLKMIFDVLGTHRLIGMIQPRSGAPVEGTVDGVMRVGCAGRVTSFTETMDGRLMINLLGFCRFKAVEEVTTISSYRQVVCDWAPFTSDVAVKVFNDSIKLDRELMIRNLKAYTAMKKIEADWDYVNRLAILPLINFLAMNLPFDMADKQVLLECVTDDERYEILNAMLEMYVIQNVAENSTKH